MRDYHGWPRPFTIRWEPEESYLNLRDIRGEMKTTSGTELKHDPNDDESLFLGRLKDSFNEDGQLEIDDDFYAIILRVLASHGIDTSPINDDDRNEAIALVDQMEEKSKDKPSVRDSIARSEFGSFDKARESIRAMSGAKPFIKTLIEKLKEAIEMVEGV